MLLALARLPELRIWFSPLTPPLSLSRAKVIKLFTFENHKMIYEHKNPFVSIPFAFRFRAI